MTNLAKRSDFPPVYDSTIDLFFKNFFDNDFFIPVTESKPGYPVDIYKDDQGLHLDIAAVGIDKSELEILTEGETLRVSYNTDKKEDNKVYLNKNIAKRKFDFAWRVPADYDLDKIEAKLDKGLLQLIIPFNELRKTKRIQIK
jgi:HSP20 family molecular chaperone IbpA